jgi:tRNA(His) 5'-end guanylyltransferase
VKLSFVQIQIALGEMPNMFATHIRLSHPADKATREDMNQAAARIVRKAAGG